MTLASFLPFHHLWRNVAVSTSFFWALGYGHMHRVEWCIELSAEGWGPSCFCGSSGATQTRTTLTTSTASTNETWTSLVATSCYYLMSLRIVIQLMLPLELFFPRGPSAGANPTRYVSVPFCSVLSSELRALVALTQFSGGRSRRFGDDLPLI